ncbi:DeoR/GlpR family DNA-binding transcription regulator [Nitratireductor soli]|uniref:DeoR/GlpR family DNA-binding transcription regulator n=1 Tax=Nitratireductor soli TaxID=1670619 RepID=UPI00065E0AF1|nr:DeoR/GlpR family DNA-binding transcription regulator [Nitratireductor soli]
MNYSPRYGQILELLTQEGTMGVNDLAQRLNVSVETVRRDVKALASHGEIVRMHGAIALPSVVSEAPFERRMRENRQSKEAIAKLAASTIRDGESVMLDTGTTTSLLARALLDHRQLTVVTNSSDIARTLATVNGNKVYMAGGELRSDSGSALGFSAIEFVGRFSVDHAIISAGAVNAATGIMDYDLEEAQFGQAVLTRGQRRVVVTDASKFGQKGLVRVCSFAEIDELIVDCMPPDDLAEALRRADVAVTMEV